MTGTKQEVDSSSVETQCGGGSWNKICQLVSPCMFGSVARKFLSELPLYSCDKVMSNL